MSLFSVWSATEGGYLWFVLCTGRFLQHRTRRVYTYSIYTNGPHHSVSRLLSLSLSFFLTRFLHPYNIYYPRVRVLHNTPEPRFVYNIITCHCVYERTVSPCIIWPVLPCSHTRTRVVIVYSTVPMYNIYNTYDLSAAGAVAAALQCPPRVFAATL